MQNMVGKSIIILINTSAHLADGLTTLSKTDGWLNDTSQCYGLQRRDTEAESLP